MIKYILIIVALLVFTSVIFMSPTENKFYTADDVSFAISNENQDTTDLSKSKNEVPDEIVSECPPVGEVIFPHREHFEDYEIECSECHHEMNAKSIDLPHEEYFDESWVDCKDCHDKPKSEEMVAHACSNCHDSQPINIADAMISKKVAIHNNCWGCHETGTGVEASESCVTCHIK